MSKSSSSSQQHAVIIIPTYNERENIPDLLEALDDIIATIKTWKVSVLIVDDTSPDKTYELVKKLKKKFSFLELLINKEKAGLGAAYIKGMDHAFDKMDADAVFEFDADLSHDPKKIPEFLKAIDNGSDMVLGSRYIKGGGIPEDWGFHRKFLSIVGNLVITVVFTDFSIRDWTSGYRAIKKKVFKSVKPHLTSERFQGYTFQIGFLRTAMRQGYTITEVPFKFVDRAYGQSKLGPEYIKNNLIYIFKTRIQEIVEMRIFKFALAGGMGASIQLLTLQLYRLFIPYQVALFFAIESAILANFMVNNAWTFSDRTLSFSQMPFKFLQFNLASGGSILIQMIIGVLGAHFIGLFDLFTLPIIQYPVDTGTLFAVIGILTGMFWNFFAYSNFIWKEGKTDQIYQDTK